MLYLTLPLLSTLRLRLAFNWVQHNTIDLDGTQACKCYTVVGKVLEVEEQESIRDMLKTNDERIAEATLDDEEGGHGNSFAFGSEEDGKEQAGFGPTRPNPFEATLLDQILAMILGGLPKEKDASGKDVKTSEEHYRYIRDEHKSIVKEWLEVFGRMPESQDSAF